MKSDISVGVNLAPSAGAYKPTPGVSLAENNPPPKVEKAESPAVAESQQNAKRASVTVTAEQVQAQLDKAVEALNKLSINSGRGLQFKADTHLGRHTITVTNTSTGEVVRTIATEIAVKVANGQIDHKGLLHDQAS